MTIIDIVSHTPHWVFGLLAVLIAFGLLQARTRQVRIQVALILPVAMLILSLSGVVIYVGLKLVAIVGWMLGIATVSILTMKIMDKNSARFDSESRKLIIRGSWLPLLVILGIFITRYALGVATAMHLDIVQAAYFPISVSLILGAWSGFFLARGLVFWQAKQAQTII